MHKYLDILGVYYKMNELRNSTDKFVKGCYWWLKRKKLINEYKQYLAQTDYVISKLNEAKIEDEVLFNSLKEEYAEVLTKRKEARPKIN